MEEIEKYVRALGKEVYGTNAEREAFQAEIRSHLLETVKELRGQGMSEDESVGAALRRFGEQRVIGTELRKVIRFQHSFKKSLLVAAVACLLLAMALLTILLTVQHNKTTAFDGMQRSYHEQIAPRIAAKGGVAEEELARLFEANKGVLRFVHVIREQEGTAKQSQANVRTYPSDVPQDQLNVQPFFTYPVSNDETGESWEVRLALKTEIFNTRPLDTALAAAAASFAAYWLLFGLWSILNAQHAGRLNVVWAILFLTLNVAGYLLYKLALWRQARAGEGSIVFSG